jgi:hypothetical protein
MNYNPFTPIIGNVYKDPIYIIVEESKDILITDAEGHRFKYPASPGAIPIAIKILHTPIVCSAIYTKDN